MPVPAADGPAHPGHMSGGERERSALLLSGCHAGQALPALVEQELLCGGVSFSPPRPVAFFPGTFDPFTLSHKGIVRAIRDEGFEVLLAIDEFSWSKRTQPYRVRREIAAMSVADEFYVHIFPEDFPVNIANPENLRRLRRAFPGREVSIVVGSDVVAHASSYRKPTEPDSIHSFNHVIFRRAGADMVGGLRLYQRQGAGADPARGAGGDQLHPHPGGGGR